MGNKALKIADKIGEGIGVGLMAGAVGTIALTLCQMADMKLTGRKPGVGPANALEKALGLRPKPGTKKQLSRKIHWVYGSLWGVARGILEAAGMNKWAATGAHFAAITGTGMALAPLEGQNPVTLWTKKEIAMEIAHNAVYAITVGLVFDAIFGTE